MKNDNSDVQSKSLTPQSIDTDVLVIGGGAAGCFAAFGADDAGMKALIVEKAGIRRSGNLATGVDDAQFAKAGITCTEEYFVKSILDSAEGMFNPGLAKVLAHECYDRFLDLEKIGVKMRNDNGELNRFPNRHPGSFWFEGADLKRRLTQELHRRDIKILQHTIAVRLMRASDRISGAYCYNVRSGGAYVIRARSVILATGGSNRLYSMKGGAFLVQSCPACSGDGISLAYHAGAELTGMEFKSVRVAASNPRIIPALGTLIDAQVPVVDKEGQKITTTGHRADALSFTLIERRKRGEGPLYWDFPSIPDESREHFVKSAQNERPICLKNLKGNGIDLSNDRIEIAELEQEGIAPHLGGVVIDRDCRTSIEGLYAAGDTIALAGTKGNSALSAMTLGHRAGRSAAIYSRKVDHQDIAMHSVDEAGSLITRSLNSISGMKAIELENRVKDLMTEYCGVEKCGKEMEAGLQHLETLKDEKLPDIAADNPHEVMRSLELRNIFDVAEMHLKASLMRTESRLGLMHYRTDYPDQDDAHWQKIIIVKKTAEGRMEMEKTDFPWRRTE